MFYDALGDLTPMSSSNQASGDTWWTLVELCLTKVYVLGLTFD
jgi:hypothetical protein